jgi:hypothetical protein
MFQNPSQVQEIGDRRITDSLTRSGIVYLSKTVSEIYEAPDNFKEFMFVVK